MNMSTHLESERRGRNQDHQFQMCRESGCVPDLVRRLNFWSTLCDRYSHWTSLCVVPFPGQSGHLVRKGQSKGKSFGCKLKKTINWSYKSDLEQSENENNSWSKNTRNVFMSSNHYWYLNASRMAASLPLNISKSAASTAGVTARQKKGESFRSTCVLSTARILLCSVGLTLTFEKALASTKEALFWRKAAK